MLLNYETYHFLSCIFLAQDPEMKHGSKVHSVTNVQFELTRGLLTLCSWSLSLRHFSWAAQRAAWSGCAGRCVPAAWATESGTARVHGTAACVGTEFLPCEHFQEGYSLRERFCHQPANGRGKAGLALERGSHFVVTRTAV